MSIEIGTLSGLATMLRKLGSVIAQRVWRQHPDLVGGLILAATTDRFRTNGRETVFHAGMEVAIVAFHRNLAQWIATHGG